MSKNQTAKRARLVGCRNGITVELLCDNMQRMFIARLPDCQQEFGKLLLGGVNALIHARFVHRILKKRGYEVEVDDCLRVEQCVKEVASGTCSMGSIRRLIFCLGCSWVSLDIKLEIGRLFAQLYNQNERGGGLNGFRIIEVAEYTNMQDNLEAKNHQILNLLHENDVLRTRIAQQQDLHVDMPIGL